MGRGARRIELFTRRARRQTGRTRGTTAFQFKGTTRALATGGVVGRGARTVKLLPGRAGRRTRKAVGVVGRCFVGRICTGDTSCVCGQGASRTGEGFPSWAGTAAGFTGGPIRSGLEKVGVARSARGVRGPGTLALEFIPRCTRVGAEGAGAIACRIARARFILGACEARAAGPASIRTATTAGDKEETGSAR